MKLEFSQQIFEKRSTFIKIRPVEAELFHVEKQTDRQTDGRTDGYDEANSRFPQFCEGI